MVAWRKLFYVNHRAHFSIISLTDNVPRGPLLHIFVLLYRTIILTAGSFEFLWFFVERKQHPPDTFRYIDVCKVMLIEPYKVTHIIGGFCIYMYTISYRARRITRSKLRTRWLTD